MANEELQQRKIFINGQLKGTVFGSYEYLDLGGTNLSSLVTAGLPVILPASHAYSCSQYKATKKPASLMPDQVYVDRKSGQLVCVAVCEHKKSGLFSGNKGATYAISAQEQALLSASALGAPLAVATDGVKFFYIDTFASLKTQSIVLHTETKSFSPAILDDLLTGGASIAKDPTPLAERIWQLIWHATKAEPKECLLTFVEIFVMKFLSDNLSSSVLPADLSFYRLVGDPADFKNTTGLSEIEYYVGQIRPKIKSIFPDNTICADASIANIFGLSTVVSKTSVINGFVFLQSGNQTHESYNATFRSIIEAFNDFGPLTNIDPEFKLRLYETFLRRSARQQRLGQFFTPRNVVRPMVQMAQLSKLPDGATVLDPAAGVGGFVLEPLMWADALKDNIKFESGKPIRRIKTIGIDVDSDLHILAKANMLLHISEQVRNPATTPLALNQAMAQSFVLMDDNKTLGSLMNPPVDSVDVILTNPPYVTRGSAIYKETIKNIAGPRNTKILKDYYEKAGLGVEALFMRYISGALKPGGRAFVVVPQGLLNRTEPGPRQQLLDECNLIASIQLPRNTFFNTAQKTYILALERRHSPVDPRPDVLCGLARSIGETLDWRRTPTPSDNDLADIANAFVQLQEPGNADLSPLDVVKIVPADKFNADDRWDVVRFWSDDELVALGENTSPVDRTAFIEEARTNLEQLSIDLEEVKSELEKLTSGKMLSISLADESLLSVRSGTRITTQQIQQNPPETGNPLDEVPVYSCFKNDTILKGIVSKKWLESHTKRNRSGAITLKFPIEESPSVTVNANGASVGKVFVRPSACLLTDDVIAVQPLKGINLDLPYLSIALQSAVTAGGFLYEAKLFVTRLKELQINIPIDEDDKFDLVQQKLIASATKRFEGVIERLAELGRWSSEARIV